MTNSIHRDMTNLFQKRLHQLLIDHADLCQRGELPDREIMEMMILGLLRELAAGAISAGIGEETFVFSCQAGYQIVSEYRKKKTGRRKAK